MELNRRFSIRVGCSGWQYAHWRGHFYPGVRVFQQRHRRSCPDGCGAPAPTDSGSAPCLAGTFTVPLSTSRRDTETRRSSYQCGADLDGRRNDYLVPSTNAGQLTISELKRQARALLANTLRELANIAAGAMVFGRFLADRPSSVWWALVGVTLWGLFVGLAIAVVKRNEP